MRLGLMRLIMGVVLVSGRYLHGADAAKESVLPNSTGGLVAKGFNLMHQGTRFRGAEFVSQSPTTILIRQFKMETQRKDGAPDLTVVAPECVFDMTTKSASSAGAIEVQRADGLFTIQGKGFYWNQQQSSLIISNQVRAVIRKTQLPTPTSP